MRSSLQLGWSRAMSHETWQLSCHLASIWIKSEAVSSSTKYDFWLASVQLTNTKIGEADRVIFGAKWWQRKFLAGVLSRVLCDAAAEAWGAERLWEQMATFSSLLFSMFSQFVLPNYPSFFMWICVDLATQCLDRTVTRMVSSFPLPLSLSTSGKALRI